jgi:hypothetical protein
VGEKADLTQEMFLSWTSSNLGFTISIAGIILLLPQSCSKREREALVSISGLEVVWQEAANKVSGLR